MSPASTTAASAAATAQTVDPARVNPQPQIAQRGKGDPRGLAPGMFGLGFPAMPLSPPYDSSASGSLAEGASERGHEEEDEEEEDEDDEMDGLQVKQESVELFAPPQPQPHPPAHSQAMPTLQLPQQTPQQRDAFAMLGLSQEQQQQIIQQLLASLTGSGNKGSANALASSSRPAAGVRPATVMAPPTATPALTTSSSFTPASTADSRRPSTAMSSTASSSSRGESSTPPPPLQRTAGGKGKGKAGEASCTPGRAVPGVSLAHPEALVDAPLPPLPALFGGLKGKGGKKGGGMSSVVIADGEEVEEEDIWRPTVNTSVFSADFSAFSS